jgi:hypothetical protein
MSVSITPGASATMRAPWGRPDSSSATAAVAGAAGHRPPSEAGGDVEHPTVGGPVGGRAQERGGEQQRRLQPDPDGQRELSRVALAQRTGGGERGGVVDQGGVVGGLGLQPVGEARGGRGRVGEVERPLGEAGALGCDGREAGVGVAREREQVGAGLQQPDGHRPSHAAGGARENDDHGRSLGGLRQAQPSCGGLVNDP